MKSCEKEDLPNYGILQCELDQKEIDYLWKLVHKYLPGAKWDARDGNRLYSIENEADKQFSINDDDLYFQDNCLMPAAEKYFKEYGVPFKFKTTHYHQLAFNRFWGRASNHGDYQSIHDHQGVFTFVVWLKIPFDHEEERSAQPGFRPEAGDFVLVYPDTCGQLIKRNFVLSERAEGKMLFFPSDINHIVYPHFTTKDYRISLAGDITLDSNHCEGLINPSTKET
tara:strand:- start:617 stop:1291 length:675 start_codon:yes stop_codon:yes gene_type:complete